MLHACSSFFAESRARLSESRSECEAKCEPSDIEPETQGSIGPLVSALYSIQPNTNLIAVMSHAQCRPCTPQALPCHGRAPFKLASTSTWYGLEYLADNPTDIFTDCWHKKIGEGPITWMTRTMMTGMPTRARSHKE